MNQIPLLPVRKLSVVVPCYNEADNIAELVRRIRAACEGIDHEVILVNDGSTDETAQRIREAAREPGVGMVSFYRNAGHQNAIRAGLLRACGDFTVIMDADLQHPPECIPDMYAKACEGYDVVNMVRQGRQRGFFKRFLSRGFYLFFNRISGDHMLRQSSDFKLLSRRVVETIRGLKEKNLVLWAMIPSFGFPTGDLPYEVGERFAGKGSYTLRKSLQLAVKSVVNFTTFPLDAGLAVGVVVSFLAFCYALFAIYVRLFTDRSTPGYTDLIVSILFFSGVILMYLGVIGRYLSTAIDNIKDRPAFLVETEIRPDEIPD